VILHLVPAAVWQAHRDAATYAPEAYAEEGFVHCSPDREVMLRVANRYYGAVEGDVLVLALDEHRLTSEVRWEAPTPPGPPDDNGEGREVGGVGPRPAHPLADVRFPHVYGPLDLAAVVEIRRLVRAGGRFASYEPWDG
jgi:uncharacterized protein (DUF952 family)